MTNNVNAPFGFRPVKHLDGSPFNSAGQLCYVPSSDGTALFVGDVVKLATGVETTYGVPTVTAAGATDVPYGVVVGADPVLGVSTPNLYISYRPASTAQYVYVVNMTDAIFAVQLSGASAAADIGKNASLTAATGGSTVSGLSGMKLDSTTIATTNTLQFHILDVYNSSGNVLGNNYCIYEVVPNIHALAYSTAGV